MPRALWRVVLWGWVVFHGRGTPVGPSLYVDRTHFFPSIRSSSRKTLREHFQFLERGPPTRDRGFFYRARWVGPSPNTNRTVFFPCGSNITVCLTFGYEYPLRPSKREVNRRMMNRNVTYRYVRNVRNVLWCFGAFITPTSLLPRTSLGPDIY